jgi:hypothetical protein
MLLDGPWPKEENRFAKALDVICRSAAAPCCVAACAMAVLGWSTLVNTTRDRWKPILHFDPDAPAAQDFAYVQKVAGRQPFDMISPHQAIFHAQMARQATLPGPGLDELMLAVDAERDIAHFKNDGPPHLFFATDALFDQRGTFQSTPWLTDRMADLRSAYSLEDWSPDGAIAHFVRKPYAGPDLLDWKAPASAADEHGRMPAYMAPDPRTGEMRADLGRRVPAPLDWIPKPAARFRLMLRVKPAANQSHLAAIASTHGGAFRGVVIYAPPETPPGTWSLGAGDTSKWNDGDHFTLPIDKVSTLDLRYGPEAIELLVDGRQVAHLKTDAAHPFSEGYFPLTIGDWQGHDRAFVGKILEAEYYDLTR